MQGKLITGLLGCLFASHAAFADLDSPFLADHAVKGFIKEMHQQHGMSEQTLEQWFASTKKDPRVIKFMTTPYEAKPWYQYEPLFVDKGRIEQGVQFMKQNAKTLARAEKEFGVPKEIITAIIGVETRYGKVTGHHPVFQALSTLAFDYPKRGAFFRKELASFLVLSEKQGWDPLSIKGSYAGAMGQAQFIPSSYAHYAIDYTGNGKTDLINTVDDAIGSVANYFKKHGWRSGEPVVERVQLSRAPDTKWVAPGNSPKPNLKLSTLANVLEHPSVTAKQDSLVSLVELDESANQKGHYIGHHNFYVITRYNHSQLYAMAVVNLSKAIVEHSRTL